MAQTLNPFNYIRRQGRMTKSQDRGYAAAERYRTQVGLINDLPQPLGIEIGFGMGHSLLEWAEAKPDWQLIGVELYRPGVGATAAEIAARDLATVHLVEEPAQVLCAALSTDLMNEIRIFFPDPWPKKRHAKRRLIQPDFVRQLGRVLVSGGQLKLATDWTPYAAWMREVMAGVPGFVCELDQIRTAQDNAIPEGAGRTQTKFERRGAGLGHDTHDLIYVWEGKNSATTESR